MIRHIVLFTFVTDDEAQRASQFAEMRSRLHGLVGVIPGLKSMSVERDLALVDEHWHIALVSEHDDNAALEAYQAHPAHLEVGGFIRSITAQRATVDSAA